MYTYKGVNVNVKKVRDCVQSQETKKSYRELLAICLNQKISILLSIVLISSGVIRHKVVV